MTKIVYKKNEVGLVYEIFSFSEYFINMYRF